MLAAVSDKNDKQAKKGLTFSPALPSAVPASSAQSSLASKQASAAVQVSSAQAQSKKISLEITVPSMGPEFFLKIPFLALLFLIFAFSLYLLAQSQVVSSEWLSEVARLEQYLLPRLVSPAFLLFLFFISASFALSAFFGFGQKSRSNALFPLLVTIVPALILGLAYPKLLLVFVALSISVSSSAFFTSKIEKPSLASAWRVLDNPMIVLIALSFFVAFFTVQAENDYFFSKFTDGFVGLAPAAVGSVANAAANAVENYPLDDQVLKSFVSEKEAKVVYNSLRETFVSSYTGGTRQLVEAAFTDFDKLNDSVKQSFTASLQNSVIAAAPQIKSSLSSSLRELGKKEVSKEQLASAKSMIAGMKEFQTIKELFPLSMALLVVSLVATLKIPVRALATGLAFLLMKL